MCELISYIIRWIGNISVPFIFTGSVKENICLKYNFDYERLKTILENLNLIPLGNSLNFEDVIDKKLDFRAKQISGGQAQRIALARTLYCPKELMLFDEPTAAIDPKSINNILEMFLEIKGKYTILIIAHSNIFDSLADRILNIENKKLN